jgi:hypothetical protein
VRAAALLQGLRVDIRFAFRALRHQPGLSVAIALTLGLAMAGTAGIFAIVDGVLLRPLPYEAADRLVAIFASRGDVPREPNLSYHNFLDWYAPGT